LWKGGARKNGARRRRLAACGRRAEWDVFMQSGLYVSLSGQVALQRRLETIASNVANMNTVGYRADGVTFATELARAGDSQVAFASAGPDFISRENGPLSKTDNPLDVAVQGDGWFAIQTPNGVAYTRDGRMRISETGALQTVNGFQVLDAGGAPIALDANAGPPTISADGMITQDSKQISAIGLFSIPNDARLTRTVNSGVIPNKPATPILDFTQNGVIQGTVEGSNVNPILEMSKLISVTRSFDSISNAMAQSESSLQDAIKTLGSST
jgi:flagellar basal-body rod protein FlgF